MNLVLDKFFRFSEQFTCKHSNCGGAITNFLVLSLRDIDENFGGGIVDMNTSQNSRSVICDSDNFASVLLLCHTYENLVHSFGSKRCLDQVCNGNSSNKRLLIKYKVRV
jgi:hypothetical protein